MLQLTGERLSSWAASRCGRLHAELLVSDPEFRDGSARVHVGLRRLALAFSLMGLSAAFWRDELWRSLGFVSADDFRQGSIRGYFAPMDPNNLLAQNRKWRAGDVAADLGSITARFFVAPFSEDLFFPPEDLQGRLRRGPERAVPQDRDADGPLRHVLPASGGPGGDRRGDRGDPDRLTGEFTEPARSGERSHPTGTNGTLVRT